MENLPIFHMVDLSSAFSVATMFESRGLEESRSAFEQRWINVQGAPRSVGGDPEFDKGDFKNLEMSGSISFEPRPTR